MREEVADNQAGDLYYLDRPFNNLRLGWYVIVLLHDASVHLWYSADFPLRDEIDSDLLFRTNVYNLCAFKKTNLRIRMNSRME